MDKKAGYKKVVQILPILAYGDAIGNEVLAIDDLLQRAGYQSQIFAGDIDKRIKGRNIFSLSRFQDTADTLVIYHLSTGSSVNRMMLNLTAGLIVYYHNITPPSFFRGYNAVLEKSCRNGLEDARALRDKPVMCIADSEFNRQDLIRMGYTCPIEVVPILIAFGDYDKEPDQNVIREYDRDGLTNIIFTGRVAPNKKQEDLIRSFSCYHKHYNPDSMLHIVGSYNEDDWYYIKLMKYVEELHLEDSVHFTGHIPFNQILSYYHLADLFLCLSEHEGFCVPLVEAMYFQVPIIAYDCCAVGSTLGTAGLLLDDKAPAVVAEAIHTMDKENELKRWLLKESRKQLQTFARSNIEKKITDTVRRLMDGSGW